MLKSFFDRYAVFVFSAAVLLCACFAHGQTVSPFMAFGNAQFFDNNGNLLTAGVLYSYQAGTTTQQATFTDYTGTTTNPNPTPFSSGARASIWLASTASYKFVLCIQNDGPSCAPSDVLLSVDHVPGCAGCSSSGGSTFTGTFISGSSSPASTGILELASIDSICWRNNAGNANLCISKDSSDVLALWPGTIKLPEGSCIAGGLTFEYICADSGTHHLTVNPNNSGGFRYIPVESAAGTNGHLVSYIAGGLDLQDSGATAPVSTAVTFSATPTFTATSQDQLFTMTLTGNVTSSTLVMTGLPTPSLVTFELTEDGTGGRTFVFPANVLGATPITTTANTVNVQQFVWDGTNARAIVPAPSTSVTKDFSASGCSPTNSTDASCTGTITISPAFADASYFPQLTINSVNGAFLAVSVSGSLSASSIPYTITCTFNCGTIVAPTIYIHAFHP